MPAASQTSELLIRPATPADVPLILTLIKELAEYERLAHAVTANEDLLREQLFGPRPAAEVVIGEHRGAPAGFAIYFQNFSTFLAKPGIYLEDLYVRPASRGHGLGAALLRHVAGVAARRGCGRMEWAVLDWNELAIDFYKRLGAVPMDEWTIYRLTGEALRRFGD